MKHFGERDTDSYRFPSIKEEIEGNYKEEKVPADNKKGYRIEYSYVGDWVVWSGNAANLKKGKIRIAITCAAGLAFFLIAAAQKSFVNSDQTVFVTSLLSIALFIFEAFGTLQFLLTKDLQTKRQFADLAVKLKITPIFHGGLLMMCAGCAAAAVFRSGESPLHYLTALSYALAGIASIMIFWTYRKLEQESFGEE